jgi:glycosyltransferase involved in cell wall biosynthesis
VVASDIPVFAEYLRDGENALLVPPGEPAALAGALHRLAGDRALRETLATGGKPLLDRFTWAASARTHRDIYSAATEAAAGAQTR